MARDRCNVGDTLSLTDLLLGFGETGRGIAIKAVIGFDVDGRNRRSELQPVISRVDVLVFDIPLSRIPAQPDAEVRSLPGRPRDTRARQFVTRNLRARGRGGRGSGLVFLRLRTDISGETA